MAVDVVQEFRCGGISEDVQQGRKGAIFLAQDGTTFEVAVPVAILHGKNRLKIRTKVRVVHNAERYYWERLGFTRAKRMPNMLPDTVKALWGTNEKIIVGSGSGASQPIRQPNGKPLIISAYR